MILTYLTREIKRRQKKLVDNAMSVNCNVIVFFQFMANLKQSGSRIPNAKSVKLTFSLTVSFYLTKTEKQN